VNFGSGSTDQINNTLYLLLTLLRRPTVGLVGVVCAIVLAHAARCAHRLRYSLGSYPALVPELSLAALKAIAYG
jgi:hypothetical protein